jgi:alkanesulfonate monooxygenase SsuD/methylene tetrahydromethanopterin reductase-like flavin-dependent oxidoreductase (luciferase family)
VEVGDATAPLAPGSISFRLYPHDLDATAIVDELLEQARLACDSGFDGVMISERHGGVVGNIPDPIQMAGWVAGACTGWVAPCPVLTPLRAPALIVEDAAWLGARFPGRVAVGLGAGGHDLDYEMVGSSRHDLAARFETALHFVVEHLSGRPFAAGLDRDRAVVRTIDQPIPVISAAMSRTAAQRAARCRAGIIGSSLITVARDRELSDFYTVAGGDGPRVLIRHVWLGPPPRDAINAKLAEYRASASDRGPTLATDELITSDDPAEIAERVVAAWVDSAKTCANLRIHVPAIPAARAREQIEAVGKEVVPLIRSRLPRST